MELQGTEFVIAKQIMILNLIVLVSMRMRNIFMIIWYKTNKIITKSLSKQNGYALTISRAPIMELVALLHMEYANVKEDMDQQRIALVSPCTY